ncbi:hypothetical protein DVS28_a2207 [Euzebya pacifica]|jgi:hypothetical protein|uniref:YbhB/YbcL family Raf kinase inhibitor-like protein n=1 Tax=Euzebya pacifica TaxID=1608957 RepID=A0A346XXE2_9ACTN|nr:YbhB/YbcL family Raf kinase inhibitor-like protein [Euzebya pacifica]AXV06889.1 hypothetical protein DVS28_a2207 [Euzebya pacifica]
MSAFELTSPAFDHDDELPERFTQDGTDVSPPIRWSGVPDGTAELVLIAENRDADEGVVTHWVVYGILPEETSELPEDMGDQALVQAETFELCQGLNEFDNSGYTGPLPLDERGRHRMFFRLFALDVVLDVPPGITRMELKKAAEGHIIGTAEMVGLA